MVNKTSRIKKHRDTSEVFAPALADVKPFPLRDPPMPPKLINEISSSGIANLIQTASEAVAASNQISPFIYQLILKKLGVTRRHSNLDGGIPTISTEAKEKAEAIKYFAEQGLIVSEKFEDITAIKDFKLIIRKADSAIQDIKDSRLPSESPDDFQTQKLGDLTVRVSNELLLQDIPKIYSSEDEAGNFEYRNRFVGYADQPSATTAFKNILKKYGSIMQTISSELSGNSSIRLEVEKFHNVFLICMVLESQEGSTMSADASKSILAINKTIRDILANEYGNAI